ncbi:MAG: hypothetical protein ACYTGN_18510 [Planctomycetota bacterium]|jgi:hypothetical protein
MSMLRAALITLALATVAPAAELAYRVTGYGPLVEIFADGSVKFAGKKVQGRLAKSELAALRKFVVTEQKFFDYDEAAIGKLLQAREPGPQCGTGLPLTEIRVVAAGRNATKRQILLETYATQHRDIKALVRLRAVARRLQLEGRLAKAGGRKRVEGWLKLANARLAVRHPKEPALSIEDFRDFRDFPKGEWALRPEDDPELPRTEGMCAVFSRTTGTPQRIVTARVRADGKATAVTVQP